MCFALNMFVKGHPFLATMFTRGCRFWLLLFILLAGCNQSQSGPPFDPNLEGLKLVRLVTGDEAIKAIDELGNRMAKEATPMLVQQLFLRETEAFVQQRVLAALGKIADPRSTKPICEFLERDLDPSTRGTAVFALGVRTGDGEQQEDGGDDEGSAHRHSSEGNVGDRARE